MTVGPEAGVPALPRRTGPLRVLVVEDNDEDVEALRRALGRCRPDVVLERCTGGGQARSLLEGTEPCELPRLVLLDLNMPDGDGRELLDWLRAVAGHAELPVVVLTTSTSPRDVEQSYAAGANGYVFKPVNYALFEAAIRGAVDYWVPPVAG